MIELPLTRDEKIECMVDVLTTLIVDEDFEAALNRAKEQVKSKKTDQSIQGRR